MPPRAAGLRRPACAPQTTSGLKPRRCEYSGSGYAAELAAAAVVAPRARDPPGPGPWSCVGTPRRGPRLRLGASRQQAAYAAYYRGAYGSPIALLASILYSGLHNTFDFAHPYVYIF